MRFTWSFFLLHFCNVIASSNVIDKNMLVDIAAIDPTIVIELKYATSDNFTGQQVYPSHAQAYLLPNVAQALKEAHDEFKKYGMRLKIWDAFRPFSAQEKFWSICPDERYVSNPAKGGGRHTRGTAVDLTLICDDTGIEVEMPTGFDDFSQKAHADCQEGLSKEAKKNRALLREIMEKHGFKGFATEWWHFDFADWQGYPVLRYSFEELKDVQ